MADDTIINKFVAALYDRYGAGALEVAEKQASLASDAVRESWISIVDRLRALEESRPE